MSGFSRTRQVQKDKACVTYIVSGFSRTRRVQKDKAFATYVVSGFSVPAGPEGQGLRDVRRVRLQPDPPGPKDPAYVGYSADD